MTKTIDNLLDRDASEVAVSTMGEAIEVAYNYSTGRHDWVSPAKTMMFDGENFFFGRGRGVRGNSVKMAFAETRAVKGLLPYLDATALTTKFILENEPEVAAWNLSYFLRKSERALLVRGMDYGDSTVIRSFATERYNPNLDSFEILDKLSKVKIEGVRYFSEDRPVNGRVGRDFINIQFPFPKISREIPDLPGGGTSLYSAGITLSNGETKNGTVMFFPYAQRNACRNSQYVPKWQEYGINRKHVGQMTASLLVADCVEAFWRFMNPDGEGSMHQVMDELAVAAMNEMDEKGVIKDLAKFIAMFGGGEEDAMKLASIATEYRPGRIAVANAISQYAHDLPTINLATSAKKIAGEYLFTGKFPGKLDEDAADDLAELFFGQPAEVEQQR